MNQLFPHLLNNVFDHVPCLTTDAAGSQERCHDSIIRFYNDNFLALASDFARSSLRGGVQASSKALDCPAPPSTCVKAANGTPLALQQPAAAEPVAQARRLPLSDLGTNQHNIASNVGHGLKGNAASLLFKPTSPADDARSQQGKAQRSATPEAKGRRASPYQMGNDPLSSGHASARSTDIHRAAASVRNMR